MAVAAACGLALTGGANEAAAATRTWDGSSGNPNWTFPSSGTNWNTGVLPLAGDDLQFSAAPTTVTNNNDFATGTLFNSITFLGSAGPAYTLNGNALTLGAGGLTNLSSATNTIGFTGTGITLGAAQTWNATNGALNVTSKIDLSGFTLTVGGAQNTTIGGAISGAGASSQLTKSGAGTLTLTGANTYSGTTSVNDGRLILSGALNKVNGALIVGDGTGAAGSAIVELQSFGQIADAQNVTVNEDGRFINFGETINGLTINGGTVETGAVGDLRVSSLTMTGGTVSGSQKLQLVGALNTNAAATTATISSGLSLEGATRTFTVADGAAATDLLISGAISDGIALPASGFTKAGAGVLELSGTSTYTGNTNVDGGKLTLTGTISATDQFYVGYSDADVELEISGGGKLTDVSGTIGVTSTGSGAALVTGTGSKWTSTGDLNVGFDGSENTLDVEAGGEVAAKDLRIGVGVGSTVNEVTVTGTGSKLTVTNDIKVGLAGQGNVLSLENGGTATVVKTVIGETSDATGNELKIDGTGSKLTNSGNFYLGFDGQSGAVTVSDGGKLAITLDAVIGTNSGSSGNKLTVAGLDSELTVDQTLYVGDKGDSNRLEVADGGTVTTKNLRIGNDAAASGNVVTVDGADSLLKVTGTQLRIGSGGVKSSLEITDGGVVEVTTGLTILGRLVGSDDNSLSISGAGSKLSTVDLTVGRGGKDNRVFVYEGGELAATGTVILAENAGSSGGIQIGFGGAAGTITATEIEGKLGTAFVSFSHNETAYNFAPKLTGSLSVNHVGTGTTIFSQNNTYSGGTNIFGGTLRTQATTALGTGTVALFGGVLAPSGTLDVDSLTWGDGKLQLAPASGDVVNVTNALTKAKNGGAFNIDATGLALGTYTLATFASTDFAQPDFSANLVNIAGLTLIGDFLLSPTDVKLTVSGVIATGNVIQNSTPVGTPTFADFLINGAVYTGGPTENNTVRSLIFGPGGSLRVNNTLFVTGGGVNLPGGSSIQLNGFLTTSQLNMFINSLLGGNGGVNGNLVNNGLVSPGNSPGSIRVSGNYTQSSTGTLRIEVGGASQADYDRLVVGGTAKLNGELQLVKLNRFELKRGDKITFLTAAGGVNGEFATVSNPFTSDTILEPTVVYGDTEVSLELVRGSFEKYAANWGLTPNQRAVASTLDSVSADKPNDKALMYLDGRKLAYLPGDFDKIAPEELTSIFTISTSLAVVQNTNLQRRTDDIRHGSSGFSASGLAMQGTGPGYSGSLLGMAGPTGKETKEMKAPAPEEKKWGVFVTGVGEWVDVGGDGNARGYDISTGGFTLGLDYKVSPNFVVGLAAGYAGTSADLNDGGDVSVNGGKLGVYATYFTGGFYADVAVTGGYNSYDTERSALQGTARGSTDGGELNVLVGAGYDWKVGALTIGPTATYQYSLVGINSFTETGSLAPLNIGSQNAESIRTTLGFKASYDWKVGGVLVRPEIRAAWQHEYGDSSYGLDASFANGAGDSFLVNGPSVGRDSLLIGAGVAIQCSERFSTYLYYDGEIGRTNYDRHGVSGGVRVSF